MIGRRRRRGALCAQTGTTLLEVLVVLFVMGVGLLALLTLFPLGALEMAAAIDDDRAGAVATQAVALSEAVEELLSRTGKFVTSSIAGGTADPAVARDLREEYEDLAASASVLEVQIHDLKFAFPEPRAQGYIDRLLAQIRFIERRLRKMAWLLSQIDGPPPSDLP